MCRHRRPYLPPGAAQTTLLLLHAALSGCIADEVKLAMPQTCTRPSQHAGKDEHADRATVVQLPLQRALVRQAAVFLPTLSALALSAVHKMLQIVKSEGAAVSMSKVCPRVSGNHRNAIHKRCTRVFDCPLQP